jgi:hypothetical protein
VTEDNFDRSSVMALIQSRIDLHEEFIRMCEANNIDPSMSLFSAIAELRSLLREIEGHD